MRGPSATAKLCHRSVDDILYRFCLINSRHNFHRVVEAVPTVDRYLKIRVESVVRTGLESTQSGKVASFPNGFEAGRQLRGQADGRQVANAKVGVTVNQGLFGHGSSVVVQR